METLETRTCNACQNALPLTEFYAHPRGKDGRNSQCKACMKEAQRRYYEQNRERVRCTQLEYRMRPEYRAKLDRAKQKRLAAKGQAPEQQDQQQAS